MGYPSAPPFAGPKDEKTKIGTEMSKFSELFEGVTLKSKSGDIDPASLDGKTAVALYFS